MTPDGYRLAARPTNYRGTQMRSRLEAKVAGALDAAGIPWEYEPHALADGADQWLPDFRLGTADGSRAYVEVRPTLELLERDLPRYTRIAAVCDPAATVIGVGFDDGDPLDAVTVDGDRLVHLRFATPRRVEHNGVATVAPAPKMSLLPVPVALRRRAGEVARLAKITRDMRLIRTPDGRGFTRVDGPIVIPLLPENNSSEPTLADGISAAYHEVYGRPPSAEKMQEHLTDLTARCTVVEEICQAAACLADDRYLLDLGHDYPQGRVVTITPTGWRLSTSSPLPLYRRYVSKLPLPTPGGHVDDLFDLLNVHEDDFEVFIDYLAAHYLPGRPRPYAYAQGEPMTGQTFDQRRNHSEYFDPLAEIRRLIRHGSGYSLDKPEYDSELGRTVYPDPHHDVRFVRLHDRSSNDVAQRSVLAIKAMSGRIVGALLDRAVAILAGPRELPMSTGDQAPDAVQLLLDAFPGTTVDPS